MRSRLALAAAVALAVTTLAGCATTVHLEPADAANDPLCAEVTVGLRNVQTLAGQDRRWTDAQSTGAWGDPAAVLLSCGLDEPAPTSQLQCVTIEGVDWLVDPEETPLLRLTTYGRSPAVQLFVDTSKVSSNDVLSDRGLVGAVTAIPATRECTAPDALPEEFAPGG